MKKTRDHVFTQCHGELFKWASHVDLYARDPPRACVEAQDERPDAATRGSRRGGRIFPGDRQVEGPVRVRARHRLAARARAVPHFSVRARRRRLLRGHAARLGVLGEAARQHHHADRTFVAEIGWHGPFHQRAWELLYFRNIHSACAERANPSKRSRASTSTWRRAGPRHPTSRLSRRVRLGLRRGDPAGSCCSAADRRAVRHLAAWMTSRARPGAGEPVEDRAPIDPGPKGSVAKTPSSPAGKEGGHDVRIRNSGARRGVRPARSGNLGNDGSSRRRCSGTCAPTCGGGHGCAVRRAPSGSRPGTESPRRGCTGTAKNRTASRAGAIAAKGLGKLVGCCRHRRRRCFLNDVVIVPGYGRPGGHAAAAAVGLPVLAVLLCASGRLSGTRVAPASAWAPPRSATGRPGPWCAGRRGWPRTGRTGTPRPATRCGDGRGHRARRGLPGRSG